MCTFCVAQKKMCTFCLYTVAQLALMCTFLCDSFVGESMHDDGGLVFAYYKDGATNPTFLYFAHGLKEIKC